MRYVEAEAFALAADGADAHHGTHGGVILGARVGDDLDALDLVALEAVQLGSVGHAAAVDVDARRALADDLEAVTALDQTGDLAEDVTGGAGVLQDGAAHGRRKSFAREAGLGHHGGDDRLAEQFGVFREGDGGQLDERAGELDFLLDLAVADEVDAEDVGAFGGAQLEAAVLVGGVAGDDGAVGGRKIYGSETGRLAGGVYEGTAKGGLALAGGEGSSAERERAEHQERDFHKFLHFVSACNSILVHRKGNHIFHISKTFFTFFDILLARPIYYCAGVCMISIFCAGILLCAGKAEQPPANVAALPFPLPAEAGPSL